MNCKKNLRQSFDQSLPPYFFTISENGQILDPHIKPPNSAKNAVSIFFSKNNISKGMLTNLAKFYIFYLSYLSKNEKDGPTFLGHTVYCEKLEVLARTDRALSNSV